MQALQVYIPADRQQALARGGTLASRVQGTALFADISGFTSLTEALARALGSRRGVESLPHHLNKVYNALITEVDRYAGSVIGFCGDGITCWFDGDNGLKATSCALAMQESMKGFAKLVVAGEVITLALKTAVASGPAQRFLVGNPEVQLIDVIAGETLVRVAAAEHLAYKGEVVLDEHTVLQLGGQLEISAWRSGEGETRFAVVEGLYSPAHSSIPLQLPSLTQEQLRPWLLPTVYERLQAGQGEFLTELRPAVALFLRFSGINYDQDIAAGEKLDAFIRWVQSVLSRYEGTLIQFTFGDKGSYLYAAFGAPIAHEDDTRRALEAALELRVPAAELNFITQVQIGLSRGTMRTGAYGASTRRTYGVLGDEVNLAARLMMRAAPGQVIASERIYKAVADVFSWQTLGTIQIKGKSEPLAVYELLGHYQQALGLQEPSYSLPMVGREAELALIEEKIARVLAGKGQIIGITAEAGMGKSRLVAETVRLTKNYNLSVYDGACQSYGTNTPYLVWQPIWQAFFELPEDPDEQQVVLTKELKEIDGSLLPRLPLLGAVLNLSIPDNELTRSLEPQLRKDSLEALLIDCLRVKANKPFVLVLEDVHWLDRLSHDLLEVVGRAIIDMPVLILLAYRPMEPAPRVASLAHFSKVKLTEFTPEESERLIRLKLADEGEEAKEVPAELVEKLAERAQGNPFYIEELLNFLQDRGVDPSDLSVWRELELPSSLHRLILSRIDHLSEQQKITLKVASVIGRLFHLSWLLGYQPALGAPEEVRADLEVLHRLDLTPFNTPEPEPTYLFKHIVTREVVYESLAFATRAMLHEQLANFLEEHLDIERNLDLLAYHYEQSENLTKKKEYLQRAGEAAQKAYANEAAIDYYERSLPLLVKEEQTEIFLKLGEVRNLLGHYDAAATHYRQALTLAEETADGVAQAHCQQALGRLLRRQGSYIMALEWLGRAQIAYGMLSDRTGMRQTLLEIGLLRSQQGEYKLAQARLEEGLALARELSDKHGIAHALNSLGFVAFRRGDFAAARAHLEEALALARQVGDKLSIARTFRALGIMATNQSDFSEARAHLEEALALAREVGDKRGIAHSLDKLGFIAQEQGDYTVAQAHLEEALGLAREVGDKLSNAHSLNGLGMIAHEQGEYTAGRVLLEESLALEQEIGDKHGIAANLLGLAAVALQEGVDSSSRDYRRAARLVASANALLVAIGAVWESLDRSLHNRTVATVRTALDAASFEVAKLFAAHVL